MRKSLILLAALMGSTAQADVLFKGDFESGRIYPLTKGKVDSFYYAALGSNCRDARRSYSAGNDTRVVANESRAGNYALEMTLRHDCDYRPLNEGGYQKPRQAIKVLPESAGIQDGKEYWIGFSFKLPKDFVTDGVFNPDSIFQLFKEQTKGDKKARSSSVNTLSLLARDDIFELRLNDVHNNAGKLQSPKFATWPLSRGDWHDVVVNIRPCKTSTTKCSGKLDVYVGNESRRKSGQHMKPILSTTGANTTSSLQTVALNLYKYNWHCPASFTSNGKRYTQKDYKECLRYQHGTKSTAPRSIFFDELRISDGNGSMSEVAPHFAGKCKDCGTVAGVRQFPPQPPVSPTIR